MTKVPLCAGLEAPSGLARGAPEPPTEAHHGTSTDPWGNLRAGLEAATTINRKDWGLTWNAALEAGGVLVGDKVKVTLDGSDDSPQRPSPPRGS